MPSRYERPEAEPLPEPERRQLRDIEIRLARIAGFLHVITSTVQDAAWQIEDALLHDKRPDDYLLPDTLDAFEAELKLLMNQSEQAIDMMRNYQKHPGEHQAALNALHNAGMLPPQEEPPECGQQGQ